MRGAKEEVDWDGGWAMEGYELEGRGGSLVCVEEEIVGGEVGCSFAIVSFSPVVDSKCAEENAQYCAIELRGLEVELTAFSGRAVILPLSVHRLGA